MAGGRSGENKLKQPIYRLLLTALAFVLLATLACQTATGSTQSTDEVPVETDTAGTELPLSTTTVGPSPSVPLPPTMLSSTPVLPSTTEQIKTTTPPTTGGRPSIVPIDPTDVPPWTFPASVPQPVVAELFTRDG